jgi:hypothetical protein
VAKGYEKAQQAVDMRQPYEQAVAPGKPADATLLAGYLAYVKLERTQGDPARVQVGAALPLLEPAHPGRFTAASCKCMRCLRL